MIKVNDTLHGFKVMNEYPVPSLSATLYKMEYLKNGAELYYLEREDENKTFSIGFKTIPEDDTGVFHIIEHSVLCGSEKYPVKEPFVELLKGSLQTFLNAMTFPDKTMYPFATRNDKDYLNLMNVYLDAVLHPAILSNPNIFRQEGWHYEFSSDGELCRKGVVYNEMKGAYSSPERIASRELMRMLYPDSCYAYESGGSPESIPNLTYEQFLASHAKYYHPSNAQIFIDGSVNLDDALALIDTYLCDYERLGLDFDIGEASAVREKSSMLEYEIAPTEDEKDKTRVALGFLSTRFDENEKNMALAVIFDAIASTNDSPLKKKILESSLCDELDLGNNDSMYRQFIQTNFTNVKDGKADELIELFYNTVREICNEGIDKEQLEACLNRYEFKMRELDFGSMPKGIIFAISLMASTLYGGDPIQEWRIDESFEFLRSRLSGSYYEDVLKEAILDNKSAVSVVLTPSKTLGQKRDADDKAALEEIRESLSQNELDEIRKTASELEIWQKTPDTEAKLASLPALTLEDIPKEIKKIPTEIFKIGENNCIYHDISTEGISYVNMYFDMSDITEEEVYALKLYAEMTCEVPTGKYDVSTLQKKIKSNLGALNFSLENFARGKECRVYLRVSASALSSKHAEMLELIREVLLSSDFRQKEILSNILRQSKLSLEEYFVGAGHAAGNKRANAAINALSVIDEYSSGYEAYKITKDLVENFDDRYEWIISLINKIKARILNRYRLTVSMVGKRDDTLLQSLYDIVEYGEKVAPVCEIQPFGAKKEGIVIPAQIAYASSSANLYMQNKLSDGAYHVIRSILSYEYLWNVIRVQGGAYGSGFVYSAQSLNLGFYSYRDPTPARSVEMYRKSADFLRNLAKESPDLTKFIIGAVGDTSPIMPPALAGKTADIRYFAGITDEDISRSRAQILGINKEKILEIADTLDKAFENAPVCIVAGKDKIDACDFLDEVLTL